MGGRYLTLARSSPPALSGIQLSAAGTNAAEDRFQPVQLNQSCVRLLPVLAAQRLQQAHDSVLKRLPRLLRDAVAMRRLSGGFEFGQKRGHSRVGDFGLVEVHFMQRQPITAAAQGIAQRVIGFTQSLHLPRRMATLAHATDRKTGGIKGSFQSGVLALQQFKVEVDAAFKP